MSFSKWKLNRTKSSLKYLLTMGIIGGSFTLASQMLQANDRNLTIRSRNIQRAPGEPLIPSLKTVEIPRPKKLAEYIADEKAAIELGKALYWDTNVGSDNKMACASCHFNAGVDHRTKNSINPGSIGRTSNEPPTFKFAPNFNITAVNFPFHQPSDIPEQRVDTDDVFSSAGVVNSIFSAIPASGGADECNMEADDVFHGKISDGSSVNTRKVEPRQAPSVINSVFYFRLFWDGRANNIFNGVDPFGKRNKAAFVWKLVDGELKKVDIDLDQAHLASQAVGPALSGFEMSCKNRLFTDIGRKLLKRKILDNQNIHRRDSVLAHYASDRPRYEELVRKAFRPEFWANKTLIDSTAQPASMDLVDAPKFGARENFLPVSQMEANFSLFFGLAIQMYETTLISDDAPIDHFAEGNQNALTEQQKRGMAVFEGAGKCINCHSGAEMTKASYQNVSNQRLERMIMGDGKIATYDNGFYNIGVRPSKEDLGVGGKDPFGRPLSETESVKRGYTRLLGHDFDPIKNPIRSEIVRTAVKGAFKTPGLRNVELTGPYFHNGGSSTLMQTVDFYNRGSDFRKENHSDLDPDIRLLKLTQEQKNDLVAFMLSFTDERVRHKRAPFDHPSICIPNGHKGNSTLIFKDGDSGNAVDEEFCLPAVGENGLPSGQQVRPFLNLNPYQP